MIEQSLKEDTLNILRIVSNGDGLTQRDLAHHLDFSLGKTNYILKALTRRGYIKIKNFSKGRQRLRRVMYVLTQKGLSEKMKLTYLFFIRKEEEYLNLKKEWRQLQEAGRKT